MHRTPGDHERSAASESDDRLSDRLTRRYAGFAHEAGDALNETMDVMLRHRSVRRYDTARALPEGAVESLVAAGQSAATSSNMQLVSVVAVRDPSRKARLARIATQPFVKEAPVVLCFVVDLSRATRVGERTGTDLWAIPRLTTFVTAAIDCGIFAQGVVVAAETLGLGTCYIGNLRNDSRAVARILELPPRAWVAFGLCLGYEAPPYTEVRPRLPPSVVLHHETYSIDGEEEKIARYDRFFSAHEDAQGRPVGTWTQRHRARLASREYLGEAVRLDRVLADLGFPLD
ncbi:nitroreductase family protein [Microbacterium petrolearium]